MVRIIIKSTDDINGCTPPQKVILGFESITLNLDTLIIIVYTLFHNFCDNPVAYIS